MFPPANPHNLLDQNSRLAGEEASHEMMSENMVAFLSEIYGRNLSELSNSVFLPHTKLRLEERDGILYNKVTYCGQERDISVTAILAIFLNQLATEISATLAKEVGLLLFFLRQIIILRHFPLLHSHSLMDTVVIWKDQSVKHV